MNTLIELYDERAIENILAVDVFRPQRVVYLCPEEVARDKAVKRKICNFFEHAGITAEVEFLESSLFKADKILRQLANLAEKYPDCALDVTGGTDAALFAGGMISALKGVPAFTYSRKKNSFYDINNAPFADNLPCTAAYSVEDFFIMAGGTMRQGRVDNSILHRYLSTFEDFFACFLRNRRAWTDFIIYMQKVSGVPKGAPIPMKIIGNYTVKGERGGTVSANEKLLREVEAIGYIHDLKIETGVSVSFRFQDEVTRGWLRDVGSVLELYTYKACLDSGDFGDVITSAIVDWDEATGHERVSNEIDVMAARGVIPLFISCKACEVKTEAINELAILKDRFGGKGAKAAIVTSETCNAAARHRAAQMGIAVIDLEELESRRIIDRLRVIMKLASGDDLN